MNITTVYGPTPWVAPEEDIQQPSHIPVEATHFQFSVDNTIFEGFKSRENFTEERRLARLKTFGEWKLDEIVDSCDGVPEEGFLEDFATPNEFLNEEFKLKPMEWLPDTTLNMFIQNLQKKCDDMNINACLLTVQQGILLADERLEFIEIINPRTLTILQNMFRRRFWIIPTGDFQRGSLKDEYTYPLSIVRSGPEGNEVARLAQVTIPEKEDREWGFFRSNYLEPAVEGVDPGSDRLWWSKELNPSPANKFPLTKRLYYSMMCRVEAMVYEKPIGVKIFVGAYSEEEKDPTLPPGIKTIKGRGNSHWWLLIIDSFTGECFEHNSFGARKVKSSVTISNINVILKSLGYEYTELFNIIRLASPDIKKKRVLEWEKESKDTKGYMLKLISYTSAVTTVRQRNGYDCGLFCIKFMTEFIKNLQAGIEDSETKNLIPGDWESTDYRKVMHLDIIPAPCPEMASLNYLDSIGSQLNAHKDLLEKAYWHFENAGAILISFRNSNYKFRHSQLLGDEVQPLPECKPTAWGCSCGYTVIPVPMDHKVILHSTYTKITDIEDWEESDMGRVTAEGAALAESALKDEGIDKGDDLFMPAYKELLKDALKRQVLTAPLPRLLVGVCKSGAYVLSNGGAKGVEKSHEIKACGYNMRSAGTESLGPLEPGIIYPMRVNQRLWAWVSAGPELVPLIGKLDKKPGDKPEKVPEKKTDDKPGDKPEKVPEKKTDDKPGKKPDDKPEKEPDKGPEKPPEKPEKPAAPAVVGVAKVDAELENSTFMERPFKERVKITGKHAQLKARKALAKRKKVTADDDFYVSAGDSDDSIDKSVSRAQGIRARKKQRNQDTYAQKRPLYELSESELESGGEFDPTGTFRAKKRVKLSTTKENLDFYMRMGQVQQFAPTTLVGPESLLLDTYLTSGHFPQLITARELLKSRLIEEDIRLKIYFKSDFDGDGLMLDNPLPNKVLSGGFTNVVKYLKTTDLIYTNMGKDKPVLYKMDADDVLTFVRPPEVGDKASRVENLGTKEEFKHILDILDKETKAGDLSPLAGIQISRWPTFCLKGLNFTFIHKKKLYTIPERMLSKSIESGIRAFVSIYMGLEVDFTMQYQHKDELYEDFEKFRAPFLKRVKVIKGVENVNVVTKTQSMNTVAIRSIIRDKLLDLETYDLKPFDTYIPRFLDLKNFEQNCFKRFPQLASKDPSIGYNISDVPGKLTWKHFKVAADWAGFAKGIKPGELVNMSFTRDLIMREASCYREALGGPVEFLIGRWYASDEPPVKYTYAPLEKFWVYPRDIIGVKRGRFCKAIDPKGAPPYGYVVGDAKSKIPPPAEWLWGESLDVVIADLQEALESATEADVAHAQNLRVLIMSKGTKGEDLEAEAFIKKNIKLMEEKELAKKAEKAAKDAKKAAIEKLAIENAAAEKAAAEKIAVEKAAKEKVAAEKAATEKAAAEKIAKEATKKEALDDALKFAALFEKLTPKELSERMATEKAAADKVARDEATRERIIAGIVAREKAAKEKAAREKTAAGKVVREKVAVEKKAAEKEAAEKEAAEKEAAEKEAAEKEAREKATAEKIPKAAVDKVDVEKGAAEKEAAEKEAREKAAAEKASADKAIREKAAAEKKAAEKEALKKKALDDALKFAVLFEKLTPKELSERMAAEKAAADKIARDKATRESVIAGIAAREKALREAAVKAARDKALREKAAADEALRAAAAKAARAKALKEKMAATAAKEAVKKEAAEKEAAEKEAAEKEAAEKEAVEKEAAEEALREKAAEKIAAEKALREKAASEKAAMEKATMARVKALKEKIAATAAKKEAAGKKAAEKEAAEKEAAEKVAKAEVAREAAEKTLKEANEELARLKALKEKAIKDRKEKMKAEKTKDEKLDKPDDLDDPDDGWMDTLLGLALGR